MLDLKSLQEADRRCRKGFRYQAEEQDRWRSFYAYAAEGMNWAGDCDDLAATALEFVTRSFYGNKALLAHCYRLQVASPQCPAGSPYDHMVAAVRCDDGKVYVLGDTFGAIYPISQSKHRVFAFNRLSEGLTWRMDDGHLLRP